MPLHCFPLHLMRALLSMGENIRMHMSPQPLGLIPKYQVIIFIQSAHVALDHHSLKRSTLSAHCIISFDANFQLKHIRDYDQRFPGTKPGSWDPEMMSPLTMEISWVYAEGWKKRVEEVWQPSHKAGTKQRESWRDPEDTC